MRWLQNRPLEPFAFRDVLQCTALGRGHGVVEWLDAEGQVQGALGGRLGGLTKAGILAWVRMGPRFTE